VSQSNNSRVQEINTNQNQHYDALLITR